MSRPASFDGRYVAPAPADHQYPSGFRWEFADSPKREGPCIDLISPTGAIAATVYLARQVTGGYAWATWDRGGNGGENSTAIGVDAAKVEAESAVLRWGKHFKVR